MPEEPEPVEEEPEEPEPIPEEPKTPEEPKRVWIPPPDISMIPIKYQKNKFYF